MSILKITQKAGGIAGGRVLSGGPPARLRLRSGRLVRDGRPFHWSHMLAVDPAARDLGLGTRLKLYQREILLPSGVEEVRWTFDPLEARNAHLNFNHLGAEVAEYVEDMYEGEEGSELFEGIGTDRFILSWKIASERVARALADRRGRRRRNRSARRRSSILERRSRSCPRRRACGSRSRRASRTSKRGGRSVAGGLAGLHPPGVRALPRRAASGSRRSIAT